MEKDKIPQSQTNDVQNEQENIWSSGFDSKSGTTLPPPPMERTSETAAKGTEEGTQTAESTEISRGDDGRRRVDMNRNAGGKAYNRWDNKGLPSQYATTFKEKFKEQSKAFFGEELTQEQVVAKIQAAETEGKKDVAEDLRKKLFAANEYAVVETLNSPENALYEKTSSDTFCNIYAYDVVTAMGGYLPRLWWTDDMAKKIKDGTVKEDEVTLKYGDGVTQEMRANMLNDWMRSYGKEFGWVQAADMKSAQSAANNGNIVIILASNKDAKRSGHVNVILPETEQHKSRLDADGSTLPLQSQAGSVNFKYDTYTKDVTGSSNPKWWENSSHKDGAAWIFMGDGKSPILTPEQIGLAPAVSKDLVAKGAEETSGTTTNATPVKPATTTTTPGTNTGTTGTTTTPVTPVQKPAPVQKPVVPTEQTPVNQTPTSEKETGTTAPATKKDPNTLTITTGVMMLMTEGAFDGGANDTRKPHFPENLAFYRAVTPDDIAKWAKMEAKKRPRRYNQASDANDRMKVAKEGSWVVADMLDRFDPADYDKTPPPGQIIATGPNNSGLTIGMGFDLGARFGTSDKAKAKKELTDAGILEESAEKLSDAVGLRTRKAGKMAAQLRQGGLTITAKQVMDLLSNARKSYFQNFKKGVVHPAIEEVMVKINYWKGGGGAKNDVTAIFDAAKDKQGLAQFDAAIEAMGKLEGETFKVGIKFLNIVRNHLANGGKVDFRDGVESMASLTDGSNDTFRVIKEATGKDLQKQLSGKALPENSGLSTKGGTTPPKQTPTTGGNTSGNAGTSTKAKVTPAEFITNQYNAYNAGTINMVQLGKSMKPYGGGGNGKLVNILIGQLGWTEQDNFAYAMVSNSTDAELKTYDVELLAKLSESLDTWMTTSFSANATQKARVDAARTGIAMDKLKARMEQFQKSPNPKPVKKPEPAGDGKESMVYGPLLADKDWVSQANPADYPNLPTLQKGELNASSYGVACYDCCVAMLKRKGFAVGTKQLTTLQDVKADGKTSVPEGAHTKGLEIIDAQLAKGVPVIIGVDKGERSEKYHGHTQSNTTANKGRATDHWVVVHGKGKDASGKTFYIYFDPARYNVAGGTSSKDNRLVVDSTNSKTVDNDTYMKSSYVISDIRY